jgi:DNA-directed RNA polymerase specialized sigma24 family protein
VEGQPAVWEFEDLYRAHRDPVVQLAWLLTHDTAAAEDIAHDAFMSLYSVFERVENPVAYLRRSVLNGVYDRTRRRRREHRRNGLMIAGDSDRAAGPTGGVLDAIAKLPIDQRTAVVLRYWAGLPHDQVAEAMGVRPGTARSHLSRASARLRKELS